MTTLTIREIQLERLRSDVALREQSVHYARVDMAWRSPRRPTTNASVRLLSNSSNLTHMEVCCLRNGSGTALDGLRFRIQGLPLCSLSSDSDEASDLQRLARCLACLHPSLSLAAGEALLRPSGCLLGDHFASLAFRQLVLSQATNSFLLVATQHQCLAELSTCNLARLHHFLHALHRLHHLFHGCLLHGRFLHGHFLHGPM